MSLRVAQGEAHVEEVAADPPGRQDAGGEVVAPSALGMPLGGRYELESSQEPCAPLALGFRPQCSLPSSRPEPEVSECRFDRGSADEPESPESLGFRPESPKNCRGKA